MKFPFAFGVGFLGVISGAVLPISGWTSTAVAPQGFPTTFNTAFQGAGSQVGMSSGALFSSCQSLPVQLPGIMQAMGPTMMGGAASMLPDPRSCTGGGMFQAVAVFTPQMICTGSSDIQIDNNLRCEDLPNPTEMAAALFPMKASLREAACSAECKMGKAAAMAAELDCMGKAMATLAQELQAAQSQVTQLNQQDAVAVRTVNTQLDDLNVRTESVKARLMGDPASGRPGLQQVAADLKTSLNVLTAKMNDIKKLNVNLDARLQQVDRSIEMVKSARTMDCLANTPFPGFTCAQTGEASKPVNTLDYMKCRFQQQQGVSQGNMLDRSQIAQQAGKGAAAGMDSILAGIRAAAPTNTKFPTDGTLADFASQGSSVVTPNQIAAQYKSQLSGKTVAGVDLWAFFSKQMSVCEMRAKNSIDIEKKMPGSALFELQKDNTIKANDIVAEVQTQFNENNRVFQIATGVLGSPGTFNVGECENATRAGAMSCLDGIRRSVQTLVGGSPNARPFNIPISGPANLNGVNNRFLGIKCLHVNDCVQQLQNMSTDLHSTIEAGKTYKKNLVFAANQNMKSFANAVADKISPMNTLLKQKLGELNRSISAMGLTSGGLGSLNPRMVDGKDFEAEQPDGLYKPNNFQNYLSSRLGGMMDFAHSETLTATAGALGKVQTQESGNLNKIANSMARMKLLETECPRKEARDVIIDVTETLGRIRSANCTEAYGSQKECLNRLEGLITSIKGLSDKPGGVVQPIQIANLKRGTVGLCAPEVKRAAGSAVVVSASLPECEWASNAAAKITYLEMLNTPPKGTASGWR